jgi:hypothetical protein
MSSPEPANGAFFADPDKPAEPEAQEAQHSPEPVGDEAPTTSTHESASAASAAMIDVPLGTLIFRAGLLGEEQLEDALREGMRTGQRLGEVLIGRGWLQERDLGRLLAGQKGLPFVEVSADDVDPAALKLLPEEDAKLQIALPLRHDGGRLVVAVADPSNELMIENLRRTLGAPPELVVAPYAELVKAIAEAYERPRPEAPTEPEIVAVPDTPESETQLEQQAEVEPAPEIVAVPETPEPETQPDQQTEVEPAPARPLPIVLQKKSAPKPAEPQSDAQPEPEVEQAPAPRPLPIMLRPNESAAESQPAPQPTPVPSPSVETPPVDEAAVYAIETTPAPEPTPPAQPAAQPALETTPEPEPEPQAPAAQAPPGPDLILELPPDWPPTSEEPPEEPATQAPPPEAPAPEPPAQVEPPTPAPPPEAPAAEPPAQEEPVALTAVILRLTDGTLLEVGKFATVAEAAAEAQEVVIEIAAADRNGGWPFFAQRYLRPDLIVSVDLIEQGPVPVDGLRRSQR